MDDLKALASDVIDQNSAELHKISQSIWNQPELAFNEFHAHTVLTEFLEISGFTVEKSFKLPTAFRATYKTADHAEGPNIAVLCEYDALPGIGHACGHNLIAEVGVAAGLAVKEAMIASAGALKGTLTVLGCPAEEGLCGKADLLRLNAFKGVNIAMMAHPSQYNLSRPKFVMRDALSIKFHGKASHAASYPWDGVNALDAAVMCYNNISLRTATDAAYLESAWLTMNSAKSYWSLISNDPLASIYEACAIAVGIQIETDPERISKYGGSTDMGNVSHVIPSIHPKFFIGSHVSQHTKEFAVLAGDPGAQKHALNVAKALAFTALEVYNDKMLLKKIEDSFQRYKESNGTS